LTIADIDKKIVETLVELAAWRTFATRKWR